MCCLFDLCLGCVPVWVSLSRGVWFVDFDLVWFVFGIVWFLLAWWLFGFVLILASWQG